jgi:hypothetical protein
MKCCPTCDRHIRASEPQCPFCRAPAREIGAPVLAPVLVMLGLAGLLAGCSDDGFSPPENGTDSASVTSTATDGGESFTSTSAGSAGTGSFETTSVDTDDGTLDSESSGGFIYGDPDSGGVALECDVIGNDCPKGEKCVPWANDGGKVWNATRCTPLVVPPMAVGEPCTVMGSAVSGLDDCEAGSMCFHVDPEANTGTCVAFCASDEPPACADEALTCVITHDGVLLVCLSPCDPMAPECLEGTCTTVEELDVCF